MKVPSRTRLAFDASDARLVFVDPSVCASGFLVWTPSCNFDRSCRASQYACGSASSLTIQCPCSRMLTSDADIRALKLPCHTSLLLVLRCVAQCLTDLGLTNVHGFVHYQYAASFVVRSSLVARRAASVSKSSAESFGLRELSHAHENIGPDIGAETGI